MLQEKINSYLAFLESGEIYETHPKAHGKKIEIKVIGKYALPDDARGFYERARSIVSGAGFLLSFELFKNGNLE